MIGQSLGHYRIEAKLGEGGMGVVYRAVDIHLDRPVAIKVLLDGAVANADRKRRFVQEAKAASALNHPNIVTIYDIDQDHGIDFVAMEFVPGKTLDRRLSREVGLSELLKCAVQIADALAKAHSAGIVHRDLKPANIMVTDEGFVKVVDFGLAKLTDPAGDTDRTVTMDSAPSTEEGAIVGTVAYMSPEQAQGKKVDGRSDIFSFGAVLYEMITGKRPFKGESKISTLSAILHSEPVPVSKLAGGVPPELERIVTRCLRKDPDNRFQTMADLKVALREVKEESESGATAAPPARRRRWLWVAIAACLLAVVGILWMWRGQGAPAGPMHVVPLTTFPGVESAPSFSPDGQQVAFSWDVDRTGSSDIYVKLVEGGGAPLRLTTQGGDSPAWSPDGRQIAFVRAGKVYLVPPIGGAERKLGGSLDCPPLLTWTRDSKYVGANGRDKPSGPCRIVLLPVDGGPPIPITDPPPGPVGDSTPAFSPDGRMLAFFRSPAPYQEDIFVVPVDGSPPKTRGTAVRVTFDAVSMAGMAWTPDSREIVFSSIRLGVNALWRVPASGKTAPQPLGVGLHGNRPSISLTRNLLAFQESRSVSTIWRFDGPSIRTARKPPEPWIASTSQDSSPRFSPDGKKIVFASQRSGANEIWLADSDGRNQVQLTKFGRALNGTPRWSPDSRWIVLDSRVDGQPEIYVISADGGVPRRLTTDPGEDIVPSYSHDGRWIYFCSNRSGEYQLWKMPSEGGAPRQITRKGGFAALESSDGKFLYYAKSRTAPGIWKAPVDGGEESLVIEDAGGALSRYFDVLPSGICYIPEKPNPRPTILFYDFAARQTRLVATMEKPVLRIWAGLAISPDERSILVTQIDSSISDLMLVENFR